MSNFLDGHLVGFEALPDWEGATPGCFEEEYTDLYGTELIHQQIGDGSESYEKEIEKNQRRRPRKITDHPVALFLLYPPVHER